MAGVTLQIIGGVGTIGGTKVLIRDGADAVMLDCGLALRPGEDWFEGPVRPRGIGDLVALGLAPELPELYAEAGGSPATVFLSHAHLDHVSLLPWLAERIPVHATEETALLLRTLRQLDPTTDRPRAYRTMKPGERVVRGHLAVTAHLVDHDIPGACAFSVETRDGSIVYSGDLRLHGRHPERTEAFVRAAAALKPTILLLEGTRLTPEVEGGADLSESEVPTLAEEVMAAATGLAVVNTYPRDVERNIDLCRAAARAGRRLAFDSGTAALIRAVAGRLPGGAAVLGEDVSVADITQAQREWAIRLGFADLPLLVDLAPKAESSFLQAGGEPFGPFHPGWPLLLRWLRHFHLGLDPVGCSGHARPADLKRIAAEIAPRTLMPVHSRFPELLSPRAVLPEEGRVYEVASLS